MKFLYAALVILAACYVAWLVPFGSSLQVSPLDQLVLEGAQAEIANGTRYNRDMLNNYYAPRYFAGQRRSGAVYPNGDVNPGEGVCTDLVVRACRHAGVDLQQAVHEDVMSQPDSYGIARPNRYIDHRRVWVLQRYFQRHFKALTTSIGQGYENWRPGDIVVWETGSSVHMHIGIVSSRRHRWLGRPHVIHNAAYFPGVFPGRTVRQDVLPGPRALGVRVRDWRIVGHYRLSERNHERLL